jgi:hypothetical protein
VDDLARHIDQFEEGKWVRGGDAQRGKLRVFETSSSSGRRWPVSELGLVTVAVLNSPMEASRIVPLPIVPLRIVPLLISVPRSIRVHVSRCRPFRLSV